ncbi:50S ribosomal protein L10 [Buchnera aphidicola]|uniref:Large ribosomal subunit protein uL10 n=1 Tax=Buchnera aphidicola (Stegophylla sp.) TaxID=2315800 RepID=A0A4D6YAV0_9GAMM|nr:50S ribosomal protein L10 [Buchnera aphidicola (Stegophylla sp.)]QCI26232.1 50S ribosomal protein L10 [Buchnera aphidicola (Stegophylla sp.)]
MILSIQKKKNIVSKINKMAHISLSTIIANIKKINVNRITQLRKNSRINNIKIYVVKNTLLKISLKKTPLECLNNYLHGVILIAFSIHNEDNAIKLFTNFQENNKYFKIIAAVLHGKILSLSEIDRIAHLPSYNDAVAQLIRIIKISTIGKLFFVLLKIKEKKCTIK